MDRMISLLAWCLVILYAVAQWLFVFGLMAAFDYLFN